MLTFLLCAALLPSFQGSTTISVQDTVLQPGVQRFGINLGRHRIYNADILLRNVIQNPGFEPGHFNMVSHALAGSTSDRWIQDYWRIAWNNDPQDVGQPEHFWSGGSWEIVSGPSAGRSGIILDYTHENDRGTFYLDSTGFDPFPGDIMFVHQKVDDMVELTDLAVLEKFDLRPGTLGESSIRLSSDPLLTWRFALNYFLDDGWSNGDRSSGKLQLIDGDWTFSCWAKGTQPGDSLRIKLRRMGETTFLDEVIPLTTSWQSVTRAYSFPIGTDDPRSYTEQENHPILNLSIGVAGVGQEVLLDDLVFERVGTEGSPFLDQVIAGLRELRPGVLRFFGDQFGETLESSLAEAPDAGYSGFSPRERRPRIWSYRLPEFLDLCEKVGAEPWYVMPNTWTKSEIEGLVEYLAGPADGVHPYADRRAAAGQIEPWTSVFPKIHIEFGNEGWGGATAQDPFFGASLGGGVNLGLVADAGFSVFRASSDFIPQAFDLVIGGQAAFSGRQSQIESNSTSHDTIGLAPYYLKELDDIADDSAIFHPVYADAAATTEVGGDVRDSQDVLNSFGNGTELAIYELNFGTTRADPNNPIPIDTRNDIVTSHAGSLALPLRMLTWQRDLGIRTQLAFTFTGYSGKAADGEYIRLFGLVRDLLTTDRRRANFLALSLANKAVRGDVIETVQSGNDPVVSVSPANGLSTTTDLHLVQSFAFRQNAIRTLVLFNLDMVNSQDVVIDTSGPVLANKARVGILAPQDIHVDNEDGLNLEIEYRSLPSFADGFQMSLPPGAMVVLGWAQ